MRKCYVGTMLPYFVKQKMRMQALNNIKRKVKRVQTGVRIEKRILNVLKALAARNEMSLGDLMEGIVLHSFEGKAPFGTENLRFIEQMRQAYELDLTAADSHKLEEE
jgi:hypothetical protein